jgi:hypothetical protein
MTPTAIGLDWRPSVLARLDDSTVLALTGTGRSPAPVSYGWTRVLHPPAKARGADADPRDARPP